MTEIERLMLLSLWHGLPNQKWYSPKLQSLAIELHLSSGSVRLQPCILHVQLLLLSSKAATFQARTIDRVYLTQDTALG